MSRAGGCYHFPHNAICMYGCIVKGAMAPRTVATYLTLSYPLDAAGGTECQAGCQRGAACAVQFQGMWQERTERVSGKLRACCAVARVAVTVLWLRRPQDSDFQQ